MRIGVRGCCEVDKEKGDGFKSGLQKGGKQSVGGETKIVERLGYSPVVVHGERKRMLYGRQTGENAAEWLEEREGGIREMGSGMS